MTPDRTITLAGAGLAGTLLAILLARDGWDVEVFEKRPDPRRAGYEGGRSINLALAERGRHALAQAGLAEAVMAQAVMMRGRMVHGADGGAPVLLPYGQAEHEVIWSVHRGRLNLCLLDAAEAAGVRLHFDTRVEAVDFDARTLALAGVDGAARAHAFSVLVGADGAGSPVRRAMDARAPLGEAIEWLDHGYKELEIPPAADGGFRIEPNALHIWPRGRYMCIALPNTERSFTVTLFLPHRAEAGTPGFDAIAGGAAAEALFARDFPGALAHMPTLARDFDQHPVGQLATLRLQRWRIGGEAVLLGDAAHAMVPFHGQGMNCAFEDCVALAAWLKRAPDTAAAFAGFEAERRPNAEAIQAMALENYLEMRDKVDDPGFLLQRELERLLARRHPERFVPRYSMVTFLRVPYALARARGETQRQLLAEACAGATRLEQVDLARADALVLARLRPLDEAVAAAVALAA
jgi:kynurenine 3-monooxygenase